MKRRLLNLLTGLSLLLCAAVVVLWVLSYCGVNLSAGYFRGFPFGHSDASKNFRLKAGGYGFAGWARRGGLYFYWQELGSQRRRLGVGIAYAQVPHTVLGFGLNRQAGGPTPHGAYRWAKQGMLRVPMWPLAAALLPLPAWSLVRAARRRRARRRYERGLCPGCGYDRRATPEWCPECGTTASVSTTG